MTNDLEEMRKGALGTRFDVLHSICLEETRKKRTLISLAGYRAKIWTRYLLNMQQESWSKKED